MKLFAKSIFKKFTYILLIISIVILVIMYANLSHTIEVLSKTMISNTIKKTETELHSFFDPVISTITIAKERGQLGIYDSMDIWAFNDFFSPLIKTLPQISSMMLGTTEGNEFMLLQLNDKWINRITTKGSTEELPVELFWNVDQYGKIGLIEKRSKSKPYDPRVRPWFNGAIKNPNNEEPFWTDPYTFFTTKDPGITLSAKWQNSVDTNIYAVIAFDVLLMDISRFTSSMETSKNGKAFVLTKDLKVLGLPKDPRFKTIDSLKKYVLSTTDGLNIYPLETAVNEWKSNNRSVEFYTFVSEGKKYWAGIEPFNLGTSNKLLIGVLVPESDFVSEVQKTKNIILAGFILIILFTFIISRAYGQIRKDNVVIAEERDKNEKLLLNTLPTKVVQDLKEKGSTSPEKFPNVTVYFSDVVGFTNMSTELDPKQLIDELNEIFTAFDDIMTRNECERIKTIGDAYMGVCGMPEPNNNHAVNMLKASIEIMEYLDERNKKTDLTWKIRIGLNSGKVVGGIVGVRKYIYDVFGDTINTASRMESNSEPMKINISDTTYELVKDSDLTIKENISFETREIIHVKGKGEMKMYFVNY